MYQGVSSLNLDDKGRFAIPAKYREALLASCGGQMVVTLNPFQKCLLVYPEPEWQRLYADLNGMRNSRPQIAQTQRLLMGYAHDYQMTAQGRIQIPAKLRELAGLDKQAALVGQGKKFELWDEVSWDEMTLGWLKAGREQDDDSAEIFDALSL